MIKNQYTEKAIMGGRKMNQDTINSENTNSKSISVLDLNSSDARDFFLKHNSYCNFDLPQYFTFDILLEKVNDILSLNNFSDLRCMKPEECENVNYKIINNKNGSFAWRPLQLIHPALYVHLVHQITNDSNWELIKKRFNELNSYERLTCLSLPRKSLTKEKDKAKQISFWWNEVEQKSIELSLEYDYIFKADLANFYSSIYTHTIPWSIHEKTIAKNNRNDTNMIGNIIDRSMQKMNYGQTNGIPQGTVLMDFIAEIILAYADNELIKKIDAKFKKSQDFTILRYRDDYRIFVNNPQKGNQILKTLTEVMIDLGLKLNLAKTQSSENVISSSIKRDKLSWINNAHSADTIQEELLIIREHSIRFPNSGSIVKALFGFSNKLKLNTINKPEVLISIIVDIAFHNPKTYPVSALILSKLLSSLKYDDSGQIIIKKIISKFSKIPNTSYMQIWLQRITKSYRDLDNDFFNDELCKIVHGKDSNVNIWNNEWISNHELKNVIQDKSNFFDERKYIELEPTMNDKEIELFLSY